MRLSLLPGLVENLWLNLAQKAPGLAAYQIGKVFRIGAQGAPEERSNLTGLLYGARARRGLRNGRAASFDFLSCKGLVEGAFEVSRVDAPLDWRPAGAAAYHPGRAALVADPRHRLGVVGQLHPDLCDTLELPPCYVFELDLDTLLEYAPRQITIRTLPRFPAVSRDFALIVDRDFESRRILDWLKSQHEKLIEDVEVFDEYRGAPIADGKKSLAYQISYRAEDRTLTDAEVSTLHQKLVAEIGKVFGAELRS